MHLDYEKHGNVLINNLSSNICFRSLNLIHFQLLPGPYRWFTLNEFANYYLFDSKQFLRRQIEEKDAVNKQMVRTKSDLVHSNEELKRQLEEETKGRNVMAHQEFHDLELGIKRTKNGFVQYISQNYFCHNTFYRLYSFFVKIFWLYPQE